MKKGIAKLLAFLMATSLFVSGMKQADVAYAADFDAYDEYGDLNTDFNYFLTWTTKEFVKNYYTDVYAQEWDYEGVCDDMYRAFCTKATNQNGFLICDGILLDYTGKETNLVIPDNVTRIMGFQGEKLKKVTIPSNVTYIINSFNGAKLKEVKILDRNGKALKLKFSCFSYAQSLKKLVLPENVEIGNDCFTGLSPSFHYTLPKYVTKIGAGSFCGNGVIKVSDSLKKIGDGSFENCYVVCKNNTPIQKYCDKKDFPIYRKATPYFNRSSLYVVKGYTEHLAFRDMGAKVQKISFTNQKIASCSGNQIKGFDVKGVKEGKTKIKVLADGKTYTCTITVLKKTKKNRIKQAIHNVTYPGMSKDEQAERLGFWLYTNCDYDYDAYMGQKPKSKKYGPYKSESALLDGYAVCQGFAEAYKDMMDAAGIECKIKGGTGQGEPHAWNLVKIGKKWANIDVTWGMGLGSDKTFEEEDHDWNKAWYPKATFDGGNYLNHY